MIPYTIGHYFVTSKRPRPSAEAPEFKAAEREVDERIGKLLGIKGKRTVDSFHRELGLALWDRCGMARTEAGLKSLLGEIPGMRERFWKEAAVLGNGASFNQALEKAGRVADYLEFAELLVTDALHRRESCGGHFREEWQEEGEAKRDDESFCYVAAWQHQGVSAEPTLHKEPLAFENVHLATRSYK